MTPHTVNPPFLSDYDDVEARHAVADEWRVRYFAAPPPPAVEAPTGAWTWFCWVMERPTLVAALGGSFTLGFVIAASWVA